MPDPSEPTVEVPTEVAEADAVEQHQLAAGLPESATGDDALPTEADPADVDEQRRPLDGGDEDDRR